MAFAARGLLSAVPFGAYRRDPRWSWIWQNMVFCLGMDDPASPDAAHMNVHDKGPARMGHGGGTALSASAGLPPRGRGAATAIPGEHYVGNRGMAFPGGTSTTNFSAKGVAYAPSPGGAGQSVSLWAPGTGSSLQGLTIAAVFLPLPADDSIRRFFTSGDTTGIVRQFIYFRAGQIVWSSNSSNLSVFYTPTRSVYVFTGRPTAYGATRSIYKDGVLLGSNTSSVYGMGTGSLTLGANPSLARASQAVAGYLELFLITRSYWSAEMVKAFSGDPFGFLRPRARRRIAPLTPEPPIPADPCSWFDDQVAPDWAATPAGQTWLASQAATAWSIGQSPSWRAAASGTDWFTEKEC